jgi:hypothetical protein
MTVGRLPTLQGIARLSDRRRDDVIDRLSRGLVVGSDERQHSKIGGKQCARAPQI